MLSIYGLVCKKWTFESRENTVVSAAILTKSMTLWTWPVWHVWRKYLSRHDPILLCSLLVKSGPTWPRLQELNFEAKEKRYCCCINAKRTIIGSLQMYITFTHFLRFLRSPSRGGDVTVYFWHKPTELALPPPLFFYSVLVSVSVFMTLSTVFRSINPPYNSPFSHTVLPVLSVPHWSFQLHVSLWKSPSALI